MKDHIFMTTAGIKIPIQPISLLDVQLAQNAVGQEFRDRGEPIDPPTYEVEVFGGDKEINNHTEITIKEASEEEQKAWGEHQDALQRMGDAVQERTALVFLEGMILDGLYPDDDKWIKRRKKLFNEDVPGDEDERQLHYVNNVLLKTPADKSGLVLEIQKLSMTGVTEEAIQAMEQLFQRQMEIQQRETLEQLKALTSQGAEDMVLQSDSKGRISGQGLENDAKSVPPIGRCGPGRNNRSGKRTKQDVGVGKLSG